MAVSGSQAAYLGAKYRRITARRGPMKALVAAEHSILTAALHRLTTGEVYRDPGPDYFIKRQPARIRARAVQHSRNSATPSPWNPSSKPGKTAGRPYFHVSRAGRP
jgi:transposase